MKKLMTQSNHWPIIRTLAMEYKNENYYYVVKGRNVDIHLIGAPDALLCHKARFGGYTLKFYTLT